MIRTQISLDEEIYRELKRRAYENGESMAAVVRKALKEALGPKPKKKKKLTLADFPFIGSASEGKPDNISERHDEILGEGRW